MCFSADVEPLADSQGDLEGMARPQSPPEPQVSPDDTTRLRLLPHRLRQDGDLHDIGGNQLATTSAKLISGKSLAKLHTVSFKAQPYLRELFADVTDSERTLVIVVGAGVSMNAGFPSWSQLIENLTGQLTDDSLRARLLHDKTESLRKAELVLQLLRQENPNSEVHEFIRDALYPQNELVRPGELAHAISRLVAARTGPTYVVTTNFDLVLEEALARRIKAPRRVRAFSLNDNEASWRKYCENGNIGVLHLHGAIPAGAKPKRPVVLADSHFLKYGIEVRTRLTDLLRDANGLFVGLSLTDPNVVGPLHDLAGQRKSFSDTRYALTPVDLPDDDGATREDAASYAVQSVRFLDETLRLRPVLLKSYGQVAQVLSDLALACADPEYLGGSTSTLQYGSRLRAALQQMYRSLGASPPDFELSTAAARNLTDNLRRALEGEGGILELLREISVEYRVAEETGAGNERFGLHLWLRTTSVADTSSEPEYGLRLMGSSTFEARDQWFLRRQCLVGRDSPYASAQAVYRSRDLKANLSPSANSRIWQGVVAVPVVLAGSASRVSVRGELLDQLTVGAITLDSTRPVLKDAQVTDAGVLAGLHQDDSDRLAVRIRTSVLKALGWSA